MFLFCPFPVHPCDSFLFCPFPVHPCDSFAISPLLLAGKESCSALLRRAVVRTLVRRYYLSLRTVLVVKIIERTLSALLTGSCDPRGPGVE
jgi:hypothetical protein